MEELGIICQGHGDGAGDRGRVGQGIGEGRGNTSREEGGDEKTPHGRVDRIKGLLRYSQKKRPGYLVGNLVATNWPIEKALHAIGYNQIPTK